MDHDPVGLAGGQAVARLQFPEAAVEPHRFRHGVDLAAVDPGGVAEPGASELGARVDDGAGEVGSGQVGIQEGSPLQVGDLAALGLEFGPAQVGLVEHGGAQALAAEIPVGQGLAPVVIPVHPQGQHRARQKQRQGEVAWVHVQDLSKQGGQSMHK